MVTPGANSVINPLSLPLLDRAIETLSDQVSVSFILGLMIMARGLVVPELSDSKMGGGDALPEITEPGICPPDWDCWAETVPQMAAMTSARKQARELWLVVIAIAIAIPISVAVTISFGLSDLIQDRHFERTGLNGR